MSRGIDEIELVGFPITSLVIEGDALSFDGDAALPFQIHGIENLSFHLPVAQAPANLNEAIRQCRFTMIDMSDDGEVSDMFLIHLMTTNVNLRREHPALGKLADTD